MKILIGSCIKEDPDILREFLMSVNELETEGSYTVDYMFIDDGNEYDSQKLLENFAFDHTGTFILKSVPLDDAARKDEVTHYWNEKKIWHVAKQKNEILHRAQSDGYDYLFILDSDLVLHPKTLLKLIERDKDIISEIFWTKWKPESVALPQVWLTDEYNLFAKEKNVNIDKSELSRRTQEFLNMLQRPGVYKVGGLGACTLISKKALNSGISFEKIYNLTFWGEDRHFCIRAAALGFKLYVDTCYPALHLYRREDLARIKEFKQLYTGLGSELPEQTLSLCLITKDEEKNIARCINSVKDIVDEIVVVDTGSKDKTVAIAEEFGVKIIHAKWEDDFSKARNIALDNASSDWILFLDADEEIARDDVDKIKEFINGSEYDAYLLKIINFAGSISSGLSEIHYNIRLFRNKESIRYRYPVHEQVTDLHTGENPFARVTDIKILHYGYLSEIVTEKNKTERYTKLISKYLDAHPNDVFQQFNLAVEYYNNGHYEKALKLLKKASKFVNTGLNYSTRLMRYMIECCLELKMYDEAYRYIIGAQDIYKDMPDFVFLEGMLYYHQHRYEKAIETFKKCLEIGEYSNGVYVSMGGTGSYRALLNMAVCYEQLGDLNSAVEKYIEALKADRDFGVAFNRLMNLLVKNEKPEDVERFFNSYVDYSLPNNHLIMCKLYIENGMPDIAEKYLNNIKYDIPGLNIFRGLIEIRRNNYEKAIDYLDLADDESINNDVLYYKVICALLIEKRGDAADIINDMSLTPLRLVLESVVYGKPYRDIQKIRDQLFTLFKYLCSIGAYDLFNEIVSLYENEFYMEDYERLGMLLKENGFYEPAINAFIKAAQINSLNSEVCRNLAEYCIEKNMIEDAVNFVLKAVDLDGDNADNYRTLLKVSALSDDEFEGIAKGIIEEKCPEIIGHVKA